MFNNLLIVCVGNICRSPMAEAIFNEEFSKCNRHNCHASSAGVAALIGHKADEQASRLMMARGLDISQHRACQLNSEMIRKADLILVMELAHKTELESREPSAKGKIFRMGEWDGYDIPDPYKLDIKAFDSALALIDQGVSQWLKKL